MYPNGTGSGTALPGTGGGSGMNPGAPTNTQP
jgi:hypothetical protein